jgi:hypothetical protein
MILLYETIEAFDRYRIGQLSSLILLFMVMYSQKPSKRSS